MPQFFIWDISVCFPPVFPKVSFCTQLMLVNGFSLTVPNFKRGLVLDPVMYFPEVFTEKFSDQKLQSIFSQNSKQHTVSSCWGEKVKVSWKKIWKSCQSTLVENKGGVLEEALYTWQHCCSPQGQPCRWAAVTCGSVIHTEARTALGTRLSDGPFYVQHMLSACKTHTNMMQNMACRGHSCRSLLWFMHFRAGDRLVAPP